MIEIKTTEMIKITTGRAEIDMMTIVEHTDLRLATGTTATKMTMTMMTDDTIQTERTVIRTKQTMIMIMTRIDQMTTKIDRVVVEEIEIGIVIETDTMIETGTGQIIMTDSCRETGHNTTGLITMTHIGKEGRFMKETRMMGMEAMVVMDLEDRSMMDMTEVVMVMFMVVMDLVLVGDLMTGKLEPHYR